MTAILDIDYVNHKGERAWRRVVPLSLRFGSSPWHDGERWFLEAIDLEKGAQRTFDLLSVHGVAGAGRPRDRSDADAATLMRMRRLQDALELVLEQSSKLPDTLAHAAGIIGTIARVAGQALDRDPRGPLPAGPDGPHPDRAAARAAGLTPARPLLVESRGAQRIAVERARQIHEEGYSDEHDDEHDEGQLALAAASIALRSLPGAVLDEGRISRYADDLMPAGWNLESKDPIRDLVRAGALIAAEIDRRLRECADPYRGHGGG